MQQRCYTCGIDIGSEKHHVIIHDIAGNAVLNKTISHNYSSFNELIITIREIEKKHGYTVEIGMEGRNGYGNPLDRLLLEAGFTVYNIDSLKLRRFRETFGVDNKTDERDASMIAILLNNKSLLENTKETPFEKIPQTNLIHEKLRVLSHYQQTIISERIRLTNRLKKHFLSYCPALLELGKLKNIRVLEFLKKYPDVTKYKRLTLQKIMKTKNIGIKKGNDILAIIQEIEYDVELVEEYTFMVKNLAEKIINLIKEEKELDKKLQVIGDESEDVKRLSTIDGIGVKNTSRFMGEIGTIEKFDKESKLAAYCGVAPINDSSGKYEKTKTTKKCNTICKQAIISIAGNNMRRNRESMNYYLKKRKEFGYNQRGSHNHALRCLARQLIKVIYRMLTEKREYYIEKVEREVA